MVDRSQATFPGISDGYGGNPRGMSLRDYFAGQALLGLLAANHNGSQMNAELAYTYADAMIEQRNKEDK